MRRALLVLAALLAGCPDAEKSVPDAATVTALPLSAVIATCADAAGVVEVRRQGAPYWEKVAVGAAFRAGDFVRTAELSSARIELLSGHRLELGPESVVVLREDSAGADGGPPRAVIKLTLGELEGFVAFEDPRGPVYVELPGGEQVRLVQGGEMTLRYRLTGGETGNELAILEGEATVLTIRGERKLEAGDALVLTYGLNEPSEKLPDFPRSLAPTPDARFLQTPEQQIALSWEPVAGARSYRVQVASDLSFFKRVAEHAGRGQTYAFKPPGAGMYAWRVATVDAKGRLGEYGYARRMFVEVRAPQELLLAPVSGAVVETDKKDTAVKFTWKPLEEVKRYRLLVSPSPDLTRAPTVDEELDGLSLVIPHLPMGRYYWGVYAGADATAPIFLAPRPLEVKRVKQKRRMPKAIDQWGG